MQSIRPHDGWWSQSYSIVHGLQLCLVCPQTQTIFNVAGAAACGFNWYWKACCIKYTIVSFTPLFLFVIKQHLCFHQGVLKFQAKFGEEIGEMSPLCLGLVQDVGFPWRIYGKLMNECTFGMTNGIYPNSLHIGISGFLFLCFGRVGESFYSA